MKFVRNLIFVLALLLPGYFDGRGIGMSKIR